MMAVLNYKISRPNAASKPAEQTIHSVRECACATRVCGISCKKKKNGRWDVRSYINKFRREESCEEGYVVVIVINRLLNEGT
jgi:hypothetical protein